MEPTVEKHVATGEFSHRCNHSLAERVMLLMWVMTKTTDIAVVFLEQVGVVSEE